MWISASSSQEFKSFINNHYLIIRESRKRRVEREKMYRSICVYTYPNFFGTVSNINGEVNGLDHTTESINGDK